MASWHENQYHISISNVNLNEPQVMPPESFQGQCKWAHCCRSNCRLELPQEAQFGMPDNDCVLAHVPGRQQPPMSGFPLMENAREDGHEIANRKQKRIIKNRESAARSRARKLAYKNELENKVAYLEQELKRLKEQKEQDAAKLAGKQDSKGVPIRRVNSGPY